MLLAGAQAARRDHISSLPGQLKGLVLLYIPAAATSISNDQVEEEAGTAIACPSSPNKQPGQWDMAATYHGHHIMYPVVDSR